MKKKLVAIIMAILSLFMVSCGKKEAPTAAASIKPVNILTMSANITAAQVIQGQLKRAGLESNIIEKKDYSTYLADLETGKFDITLTGWTTVTGNPDYAVMSLFHTTGDYNRLGISDPNLDEALAKGRMARVGSEEFKSAYANVEKIVNEEAYIVPLYYNQRTLGVSKDLDNVILNKSRSFPLEKLSWKAESNKTETDPIFVRHATVALTSLDPIKANDGTVFPINTNQYARLVNLTPSDEIEGGLATSWYSPDQVNFYFALRGDAKFSNGDILTPEDVKFSLDRAKNKEISGNKVYTVQGNIETIEILKVSDLSKEIETELAKVGEITTDNIIKITAKEPYGQLYNMLAHTSGGIVSKKAVEAAGEAYGDTNNLDLLVGSGPYVVTQVDKQKNEIELTRNEFYYDKANVKTIKFKVIPDNSGAVLALQSGDVDYIYSVPDDSRKSIAEGEKTELVARNSNAFTYIGFNNGVAGSAGVDAKLRKAIYFAIDPAEALEIALDGNGEVGASPLSPVVAGTENETGYIRPSYDLEKAKQLLTEYAETLK